MRADGYIAATRFGMGFVPEVAATIEAAPKKWLLSQINGPETNLQSFAGLTSTQENVRFRTNAVLQVMQQHPDDEVAKKEVGQEARKALHQQHIKELIAKTLHAATTETPFYERLVDFWANHFTVSTKKGELVGVCASYEREAIRPRVTGKFIDLLLAVESHPTMLVYLDNQQSVGPNSPAGQRKQKGLNENLAREIMELHTLGVNGGYTQTDVTTFAKVITGWTVTDKKSANPGVFEFAAERHEPGAQTILGKTYPDTGVQQGVAVLADLARHPATAQHIATKLAQHFIADEPPPAAVAKLAQVFQQTDGNLKAVYQALIELPEAWSLETPKIKSSYDLVVSAARLCGTQNVQPQWLVQSLVFLGNMPMTADSPAGFSDRARDTAGPEAILRRIEWAQGAAHKLKPSAHYETLANLAIGPIMSAPMARLLSGSTNEVEGLSLLLGSPEFQRR